MPTATTPKRRRGISLSDNLPPTDIPGPGPSPALVRLAEIRADDDVQPRANGLDPAYVAELAAHYHAGDALPPVTLFCCPVSGTYWCADGFHRLAAAAQVAVDALPAVILPGGKGEAMRHAMQANATHGRRRTAADMTRCYRRAVAEQWVEPADTDAVMKLLNCSERWAREITREARDQVNAERDETIHRLAAEGKSQRYIAGRTGVSPATVNGVLSVQKRKSAEIEQSEAELSAPSSSRDEGATEQVDESAITKETAPNPVKAPPAAVAKPAPRKETTRPPRLERNRQPWVEPIDLVDAVDLAIDALAAYIQGDQGPEVDAQAQRAVDALRSALDLLRIEGSAGHA